MAADVSWRWCFTLRAAEDQLALARETLASVEETLRIDRHLFEAGAVNELDLRAAARNSMASSRNSTSSAVAYQGSESRTQPGVGARVPAAIAFR